MMIFLLAPDAEGVIGSLVRSGASHIQRIFNHHLVVIGREASGVVHVPAERDEKRVNELLPRVGLFVRAAPVVRAVPQVVLHPARNIVFGLLKGDRHYCPRTDDWSLVTVCFSAPSAPSPAY